MSVASTVSSLSELLPSSELDFATRAHVARGLARAVALTLHNTAFFGFLLPGGRLRPTPAERKELRLRLAELFEEDWRNVEDGIYPAEMANDFSWRKLIEGYPALVRDAPGVRRRARTNNFADLPPGTESYPRYYQRNFHFQTDGYFGLDSAAIYELQVEFLFGGTANTMRRQVLPPLVRALRGRDVASLKILDIACGTGPVLRMLAGSLPGARLYGCDLSPHYIAHARTALADILPLSLVVENAEHLPFVDGYFDAATCVYMFHELPPAVRTVVLLEAARVLKPGGLLVFGDSIQLADDPLIRRQLEHFPVQFHEPFFRQYLHDDLRARFNEAGFDVVEVTQHFITKVVAARKRTVGHA